MKQSTTSPSWKKVISVVTLALLVVTGALLATLAFPAHAAASAHSVWRAAHPAASPPAQHCQIVLAKLHPGERSSRVLSQRCVSGKQTLVAPQSSTLLTRWFQDVDFQGNWADIYGSEGPCDSSGYAFRDTNALGFWGYAISSYKVFSNCYWTTAFSDYNEFGVCSIFAGDVNWVGYDLNDHVFSMHLSSDPEIEFAKCGPA